MGNRVREIIILALLLFPAVPVIASYESDVRQIEALTPKVSGWCIENHPEYAASARKFLASIPIYPDKRQELEYKALVVFYRSRQFGQYNELADQFLLRCKDAEKRREILDWYLHSALEKPFAMPADYRKVLEIANLLEKDEGYTDANRLREYRCMAQIRLITNPPPEDSWWVIGDALYANSYRKVLELRKDRSPVEIELIEYEALKVLYRSQQYARFNSLAEKTLPHMKTPWRHTMVLDWYLHSASCWGAGDLDRTIEIGRLLEKKDNYWDRGKIINFVFDTILRFKGKEEAYPYLLKKLRDARDENGVLMALKYSYSHPDIFEGMKPQEIAELYRSKEPFISKTKANVDVIVKLRTTVGKYERLARRKKE
jgi:hypothetical protein